MDVAIICVSRDPVDFETWVKTHRAALLWVFHDGDAVKQRKALETHADRFVLRPAPSVMGATTFVANQTRQVTAVNLALTEIPDGWRTVHIDDDELVFCPGGAESFQSVLSHLRVGWSKLTNIEAVYEEEDGKSCDDPFNRTSRFTVRPSNFTAYVNGKSVCCLADKRLTANGPHSFSERQQTDVPSYAAVVLHYESSCIESATPASVHLLGG